MNRGHLPLRTCVGCRQTRPKPDLLRIVSTGQGRGQLDAGQSSPGRGSYLCPSLDCCQRVLKKGLFRSYSNQQDLIHTIESVISNANSETDEKGC